jgi:hypothetical protein
MNRMSAKPRYNRSMPAIAIATPRRRPRFRRAVERPSFQLTDRDVEIVRHVAAHRFLRSTHLSRLLAAPHHKICERLTSLYHAGYLDRPRAQLEYYVPGGGSAPLIYALANSGARLLIERDYLKASDVDWTHKNQQAGRQFILHTLMVNDVRIALTLACRARSDIALKSPGDLLATLPDQTRADRNPWCLRVRVQHNGAVEEIGLLPDYVFALIMPDGRRRPYVVECDRGTMPVERSTLVQTSMLRKFLAYEAIRQQRLHTTRYGWTNFRVLTVTAGAERADTMCAIINRTPALKSSPLFLFAHHATLLQSDILSHPWHDPASEPHTMI